jgi:hypothetical protein
MRSMLPLIRSIFVNEECVCVFVKEEFVCVFINKCVNEVCYKYRIVLMSVCVFF